LNSLISPYNSSGNIVSGKFTTVRNISNTNRQIIELKYGDKSINIINWEHSLGQDTKNQSITREEIKCIILPNDGIKIRLQIQKHGIFQMSISYCNVSDLKNAICKEIVDKSNVKLNYENYFRIVQDIFIGIFNETPDLYSDSLKFTDETNDAKKNTVSGNAPPNKPNTSTAVCRKTDPRAGLKLGLRPSPYSFQGQCPEYRQYINPTGVLGNDNLYYPCCSAKTKISEEEYKKYLIDGFPRNETESKDYGVNYLNDSKSGVLVPGSTKIGALTRAFIQNQWTPVEIMAYKGKSQVPKTFFVKIINTGNVVEISRELLERDSRYFPGLKSFNKDQLIKCIIETLAVKKKDQNIEELENLQTIKNLITIPNPNFDPILSVYGLSNFLNDVYFVTSVPKNSSLFYLYISDTDSYYINIMGNKKVISLSVDINEKIILLGYLQDETDKFFVIDVLYYNKPITDEFSKRTELLESLSLQYFSTEDSIEFSTFYPNIIKSSKELLIESDSNVILVYLPNKNYLNLKIWTETDIEPEIILQIIEKSKGVGPNKYKLGYDNTTFTDFSNLFNNIFITKSFYDTNKIKINDYILFTKDINKQTGEIGSRILTPVEKTSKPNLTLNETLTKLSLLINPIKESFFYNNSLDQNYIWIIPNQDKILKYVSDNELLTLISMN